MLERINIYLLNFTSFFYFVNYKKFENFYIWFFSIYYSFNITIIKLFNYYTWYKIFCNYFELLNRKFNLNSIPYLSEKKYKKYKKFKKFIFKIIL